MPKSSNVSYWYSPAGTRTIRAAIAMAYSLGGNMFIPWDNYLPVPAALYTPKTGRYYGAPADYADLFSFIRGGAKPLLERDEELAELVRVVRAKRSHVHLELRRRDLAQQAAEAAAFRRVLRPRRLQRHELEHHAPDSPHVRRARVRLAAAHLGRHV